jgi:hypothetical protein
VELIERNGCLPFSRLEYPCTSGRSLSRPFHKRRLQKGQLLHPLF